MSVTDFTNNGLPENWYEAAMDVISRPLPPEWIEQRESGGQTLSYIGGEKVIRLLNEAFQYRWSFEILEEKIMAIPPKPKFRYANGQRQAVMGADGQQEMEPQPNVYQVKGRLTVPGFGIREQYGSKTLVGGASEQESAGKAASTDCLKKCASLFGIGLELYDKKPEQAKDGRQNRNNNPRPTAKPAEARPVESWQGKEAEIRKLKELKMVLGVSDNAQLNPYVRDFLKNNTSTFDDIVPGNITAFTQFLGKFAEENV